MDQTLRAIQTGVRPSNQDERSPNKRLSVLHSRQSGGLDGRRR